MVTALLALVAAWLHPVAGAALLPLAALTAWFFRDPERTPPGAEGVLLAPADGRILVAGPGRISIFMTLFDVHVCRAPAGGRVEHVSHTPGRFLAACRHAASEQNERVSIVLADGMRRVRFTLVAGLVARRIVCRVQPGQVLAAGERVGVIRFGSRVDVQLPEGARSAVEPGQRVRAGETPIARLAAPRADRLPPVREGRAANVAGPI